ncbi:hypothetical protein [Gilvibacter sp.]|uniref:hypothetical protein n=1 Tax=Gilvibacter sp. TaxID=2729997 RepID=UPI003F4A4FF0
MAVLFVGVEFSLRNIPNDYKYKADYLKTNSANIETLVLGNSHIYRAVDPTYLGPNSFSLAYVSQTLDLDLALFDHYKDDLKSVNTVILGITYPAFAKNLKTAAESWRLKNYNLYYKLPFTYTLADYSEVLSNSFETNKQLWWNYYGLDQNMIKCNALGAGPLNENRNLLKRGPAAAKRHTGENPEYRSELLEKLTDLFEYCATQDIQVVLISPPTHKAYREHLDPNQTRDFLNYIDSVQKRYSNVKAFVSFDSEDYQDKHFLDGDHLNAAGAQKFTERLNSILEEINGI